MIKIDERTVVHNPQNAFCHWIDHLYFLASKRSLSIIVKTGCDTLLNLHFKLSEFYFGNSTLQIAYFCSVGSLGFYGSYSIDLVRIWSSFLEGKKNILL